MRWRFRDFGPEYVFLNCSHPGCKNSPPSNHHQNDGTQFPSAPAPPRPGSPSVEIALILECCWLKFCSSRQNGSALLLGAGDLLMVISAGFNSPIDGVVLCLRSPCSAAPSPLPQISVVLLSAVVSRSRSICWELSRLFFCRSRCPQPPRTASVHGMGLLASGVSLATQKQFN